MPRAEYPSLAAAWCGLPSRRYQASYTGPDLALHKASSTFETLMDARAWLTDERRRIDAGNWIGPQRREAIAANLPPRYRLLVLLASWCALRWGELTDLRRSDVDLKAGKNHDPSGHDRGER